MLSECIDRFSAGAKGFDGVEGEKDDEKESAGEIKFDAIESTGDASLLDDMHVGSAGIARLCSMGPAPLSESGCSPNWNIYISVCC